MKIPLNLCVLVLCQVLALPVPAQTGPIPTPPAFQPPQNRVELNRAPLHLAIPGPPEWERFANDPSPQTRFESHFQAEANPGELTLFIHQENVKQVWPVLLNGKRIGALFPMEADLIQTLGIPAKALQDGDNVLSIVPGPEKDDIVLSEIFIEPLAPAQAIGQAELRVSVTNAKNHPLPCRITIVDEHGALAPLVALGGAEQAASIAVRPGVVYTGNGQARVGLRRGHYRIFASRGFEYGMANQEIELGAERPTEVELSISQEVTTDGLVSCDTHVHTFTLSHHGDATLQERMLTLAGEGIELPIATDHNVIANYGQVLEGSALNKEFTPVPGVELTTKVGHFNIFPVDLKASPPDANSTDWAQIMAGARATPDVRVIILNHPRSKHNGFVPFDAANFNAASGENKRGGEFSFDAMELVNSGAQQTDFMQVYRDWFALLNYGYRITGVGSSDSHDVSRYIVGQARTYIALPDQDPGHLDVAAACQSLLEGRASVSMGLLTQMRIGKFGAGDLVTGLGSEIPVEVTVLGPSWSQADHVALYANGSLIRESDLPRSKAPIKAQIRWNLPCPTQDLYLVAIATGPAVTAPFWAMTTPYQPKSPHWEGRAIGSTNPIWIDANGDGKFTNPRAYARQLLARHGVKPTELIPALSKFDQAVAIQAASLCASAGASLESPEFVEALRTAPSSVSEGFAAYLSAAKASK